MPLQVGCLLPPICFVTFKNRRDLAGGESERTRTGVEDRLKRRARSQPKKGGGLGELDFRVQRDVARRGPSRSDRRNRADLLNREIRTNVPDEETHSV